MRLHCQFLHHLQQAQVLTMRLHCHLLHHPKQAQVPRWAATYCKLKLQVYQSPDHRRVSAVDPRKTEREGHGHIHESAKDLDHAHEIEEDLGRVREIAKNHGRARKIAESSQEAAVRDHVVAGSRDLEVATGHVPNR